MKKSARRRLAILSFVLLVGMLLAPLQQAGATYVSNSGYIRTWKGYQYMVLSIDYTITGPGDYRINSSSVSGIHRLDGAWMEVYLYIYSDYPYAHWYEKLGNITYAWPWQDNFAALQTLIGNVPRSWYFNRAGHDIGVAYAKWYPWEGMRWNVQVGLP